MVAQNKIAVLRGSDMGIDLSRFKVVYRERVLKALTLLGFDFVEHTHEEDTIKKLKFIEIMVIDEDGNIKVLKDEAWMFQFIPILNN